VLASSRQEFQILKPSNFMVCNMESGSGKQPNSLEAAQSTGGIVPTLTPEISEMSVILQLLTR
jgi:hypothetical protein